LIPRKYAPIKGASGFKNRKRTAVLEKSIKIIKRKAKV
jgi:hypothetical protein